MGILVDTASNLKISDTVHFTNNYVTQTDLTALYSNFLANQSASYSTLITVLIGMTAILLTFSLIWNFVIARNQIKAAVKEEIEQVKKDLNKDMNLIITKEVSEIEKKLELKYKNNEADLSRLYTLTAFDSKQYETAVSWAVSTLRLFNELNNNTMVRLSVNLLLAYLKSNKMPITFKMGIDDYKNLIKEFTENIPEILSTEKEEILRLFEAKKPKVKGPINIVSE